MAGYVETIYDKIFPKKVVYVADGVAEKLLEKIRRDRGVELVECDGHPQLEDSLEVGVDHGEL